MHLLFAEQLNHQDDKHLHTDAVLVLVNHNPLNSEKKASNICLTFRLENSLMFNDMTGSPPILMTS